MNQYLDARLVFVVAAALEIVHLQDCFDIGQQIGFRQKFPQHLADKGRSAKTTANDDFIACLARIIVDHANTNVMGLGDSPVIG